MNFGESQRQEECSQEQVTPSKRKSMDYTNLASPLKRMSFGESDVNPAQDIFKSPPIPVKTQTGSKYAFKTLTMVELIEHTLKSNLNIAFDKIETDAGDTRHDLIGPWVYKDKSKTWIHYHIIGSSGNEPDKIRLDNLRKWGFPTSYNYKWYCWLRFKDFTQKHYTDMEQVVSYKSKFLDILCKVNFYYQNHSEYIKEEGLELYKGPQAYEERTNKEALHYYGKGWYKWYKKSEFEKQMLTMFGEDQIAIVKLQVFGHESFTPKVSSLAFEHLLKETHDALIHNLVRGDIEEKLLTCSRPQCHEDRDKQHLMNYNPDFRRKAPIMQTEAVPKNANTNSNRSQPQPILSEPLPTNQTGHASQPTTTADQSADSTDIHTVFSNCSFRVCKKCKRTRVLDERATKKFPLGTYEYGPKTVLVEFTCDKLVNTTCGSEEDIRPFMLNNDTPSDCLIVDKSKNPRLPTCSISAVITETTVTHMANDIVHDIKIVGTKASYKGGINCYKDHELNTLPERLLEQYKPGGKIVPGREGRRRFTPIIKNLQTFEFTIPEPREAKCCQPWFYKVQDPNDRFEAIGIERITTIRNLHAVVNALKILRCLKCGRQTPGLTIKYSQLSVLQQGHKKVLNDGHVGMALNNSQVLQKAYNCLLHSLTLLNVKMNQNLPLVYAQTAHLIILLMQMVSSKLTMTTNNF